MLNFIKGKILKKELSDEELYALWQASTKKESDFEQNIMKIKNNLDNIIIKEISNIKFESFTDVSNFLNFMEKASTSDNNQSNSTNKNQYTSISISSSKSRKKIYYIYEHMKFLNNIHTKKLIDSNSNDSLIYFLFSSKYEIFSFLLKNYLKDQSNNALSLFIYENYFKNDIYIHLLEYFLYLKSSNELKFLLPNKDNISYITNSKCINKYIDLKTIYPNLKEGYDLVESWINLIIYFQLKLSENEKNEGANTSASTSDEIFKTLNQYYPKENFEQLGSILALYNLIPNNTDISLFKFLSNPFEDSYKSIINIEDVYSFNELIRQLLQLTIKNADSIANIKYFPLNILRYLIINKAKFDYIVKMIEEIVDSKLYAKDTNLVQNFVLKYLIENYSDNLTSIIQFEKIINYLSNTKQIFNLYTLSKELGKNIEFISILDEVKISYTIFDIIKNSTENKLNVILNYLYKITNNFGNKNFNVYSEKHEKLIVLLMNYNMNLKRKKSVGFLLVEFFSKYNDLDKYILNVLLANKNIFFTDSEMNKLLNLFLPYATNQDMYSTIESFINEFKGKADNDIIKKLNKILSFLKLKKLFSSYKIEMSLLNDFNYNNIDDKLDEIIEIILSKILVNLDDIKSIDDLLKKNISVDIMTKLNIDKKLYLYYLFLFFLKNKKENLLGEILLIYLAMGENNQLNKCINILYNKFFNCNKEPFLSFVDRFNLRLFLLENSNMFIENFINQVDFSSIKSELNIEKNNYDIFSLFTIVKYNKNSIENNINSSNSKGNKEEYEKYLNMYNEFESLNQDEKSINKLINIYSKFNNENVNQNFQYSLHPKLVSILNQTSYWSFIKDIKIGHESKLNIYYFCLKNKIININNLCEYENINLDINMNNILEKDLINIIVNAFRIFMNLYREKIQSDIDSFLSKYITLDKESKISLNSDQQKEITRELINFNLSQLRNFTYSNIQFITKYLGFCLQKDEIEVINYLSKISNKINVLPFLSNFMEDVYPTHKLILDRYYNYYSILNNANSKFFLKDYDNIKIKFQNFEIYKIINMNNWMNLKKLFQINEKKVNVKIIFLFKLLFNYLSMSSVIEEKIQYGCTNILTMVLLLNCNEEDIKLLLEDIFHFPQLTFILEGQHNILLLDRKLENCIINYSQAKFILCEELMQMFPELLKMPLIVNKYKLFKVKHHIFSNLPKNVVNEMYEKLRIMTDFNEIYLDMKNYEYIRNEIYNIYTI